MQRYDRQNPPPPELYVSAFDWLTFAAFVVVVVVTFIAIGWFGPSVAMARIVGSL